jgi:F0F1-type ATP synthase assembly protein I
MAAGVPPNDPSSEAEKVRETTRRSNSQAAMALELPFVVMGTIAVGAAIGYFLDHWLHTKPILMLVFGGFGFAGGIREVIRRVGSG